MKIIAENLGKRFNFNWIFRNYSFQLQSGSSYAVIGHNGSGKSTFLQVLSGASPYSEGQLKYHLGHKEIEVESVYQHLSVATPSLELIEEFTLQEQLDFHFKFKKLTLGSVEEVIDRLALKNAANREIRFFSSGMKQRVKLALALFSDTKLLFLDEPTGNLDRQGIAWYNQEIQNTLSNRLVVICSNVEAEYEFCTEQIRMG